MKEKTITITLEEYKELLIYKGRYEELKGNQYTYPWYTPKITYSTSGYASTNESCNKSSEVECESYSTNNTEYLI